MEKFLVKKMIKRKRKIGKNQKILALAQVTVKVIQVKILV